MAACFKVLAFAGIVVRAEQLFAARRARAAASQLSFRWTRDADGRLIRIWCEAPRLDIVA